MQTSAHSAKLIELENEIDDNTAKIIELENEIDDYTSITSHKTYDSPSNSIHFDGALIIFLLRRPVHGMETITVEMFY